MKVIRTYTLTELEAKLRGSGLSIGRENLKAAIGNGFLAGCVFCSAVKSDSYVILARDVDAWIEAHSVDVAPDKDMLAFAGQMAAMNYAGSVTC